MLCSYAAPNLACLLLFTLGFLICIQGTHWTPSKMIQRLGKEINNPESVCYWAYKVSSGVYFCDQQ